MSNQLASEKSPYLLQHKDNPVSWFPWCREAFEKAGRENKPIFLSIGYSTCHWCHVMAHESFEDEEVAALLNREYVCIKVDREERPDIDAIYMNVCQALTGSGGWPLTVLMTPEQRPFFAGTYFPKRSRWGQIGLMELLERIADLWKQDKDRLVRMGDEITETVRCGNPADNSNPADNMEPKKEMIHAAYQLFEQQFDSRWGGFGTAPKFPTPHNLLFLMRYAVIENQKNALQMAEVTLEAMAKGGIFDHIGGGFSRYATDEKWLVPHFEKMLYDNALLILAYLEAYQMTGKKFYAEIVCRTADYILRELADDKGGFYCGQDADSEGVEGKYYVFTPGEVKVVLGETDGEEFCRQYHITQRGNFEGNSIPNRIDEKDGGWQKEDNRFEKLYQYRIKRTQLHKDDKILLSWNAWAILALSRAGRVLGQTRFLHAAQKAQCFIENNMVDEKNRLFLRHRDREAAHMGQLEDYAVYALALIELYQTTFEAAYLEKAVCRAGQMTAYFEDREKGGYFMTSLDAEQLIIRPKETYDGAIPSGNSVAAMVLQRLAFLTGEQQWWEASVRQFRFLASELGVYPVGHSYALLAMTEALYPHKELICAVSDRVPEALWQYHRQLSAYGWTILVKNKTNSQALSQCAPFTAEYPVPEDEVVYYLCEGGTCNAPVTDLSVLLKSYADAIC